MRFLIELAVAVGLCLLVLSSPLGVQNYLVIGGMLAILSAILIYSTHGLFRNIDSAPTPIWIAMTLGICIVLGMIWPAVPVIFFYERGKTRRLRAEQQRVIDGNAIDKPKDKR